MTSTSFLNHPNFAYPNIDITSGEFGTLAGLQGGKRDSLGAGPRAIEIGLRFEFQIALRHVTLLEGAAWAGERGVARVEVSTSGGEDWTVATLNWHSQPYSWVFWTYPWEVGAPGAYTVMARATDDQGNVQPKSRDPLRIDSYELNSYPSVRCEAR